MRHVTLSTFGGIAPRTSEHLLGKTSATIAHDVCLRSGRIEPWRERCKFGEVPFAARTVYVSGCHALGFRDVMQMAEVSPDWGRVYVTGRAPYAEEMTIACNGDVVFARLGVPAPLNAPSIRAAETACSRSADARAYVYTYVNAWGEESAPSPVSGVVTVDDGGVVYISNMASPPTGYLITKIRLYRAVTGFRPYDVKEQKPLTDFLLVASFPLRRSYIDSTKMVDLGYPLETSKVQPPPDGLRNIVSIDDTVRLAGCTTNRVYLSEPFQVHNWPAKYELTLDHNIVHMGGRNDTLYVTTDSIPYIIKVGDCRDGQCNQVIRGTMSLPDISCGHSHSAIVTKHGYIFSSTAGLVLLKPDATHTMLTTKWFAPEEWIKLAPETIRMGYWQGFLICITDRISFCLNIDEDLYDDMHGSELSTLSDKPIDLMVSDAGALFMLEDGEVSTWNSSDTLRPYYWESRPLTGQNEDTTQVVIGQSVQSPRGATWSAASAKVGVEGSTTFTLITPQPDVEYEKVVVDEIPFRLPRIGRHLWYKVRLQGTGIVNFLTLGTAHFTVNRGS